MSMPYFCVLLFFEMSNCPECGMIYRDDRLCVSRSSEEVERDSGPGGCLLLDERTNELILGLDFDPRTRVREYADFGGRNEVQDGNRWETAKRETLEETLGLVALGDQSAHALGDTLVYRGGPAPGEHDSGYKCFLTRLPTSDYDNFCKRFSEAVARAKAAGQRVEVTECVRFPVANVIEALRRRSRGDTDPFTIRSNMGHMCTIRGRTWQVLAREARC